MGIDISDLKSVVSLGSIREEFHALKDGSFQVDGARLVSVYLGIVSDEMLLERRKGAHVNRFDERRLGQ